eukprot:COSAG01_NODE_29974_length_625_cov_45.944867_2_plen_103_part_01
MLGIDNELTRSHTNDVINDFAGGGRGVRGHDGGRACGRCDTLLSRGVCQNRWHLLVNWDHGDSITMIKCLLGTDLIDLDGNHLQDISGSYGLNVIGYGRYKEM